MSKYINENYLINQVRRTEIPVANKHDSNLQQSSTHLYIFSKFRINKKGSEIS